MLPSHSDPHPLLETYSVPSLVTCSISSTLLPSCMLRKLAPFFYYYLLLPNTLSGVYCFYNHGDTILPIAMLPMMSDQLTSTHSASTTAFTTNLFISHVNFKFASLSLPVNISRNMEYFAVSSRAVHWFFLQNLFNILPANTAFSSSLFSSAVKSLFSTVCFTIVLLSHFSFIGNVLLPFCIKNSQ